MVKIMFKIMDCFVYCLRNKVCLSREGEYEVMHELEELSMLIVRADSEDSNHYPFWLAKVGKIENDRNSPNFNKVQVCWFTPI